MSISTTAQSARERARHADGKFGEQLRGEADITFPVQEVLSAPLYSKIPRDQRMAAMTADLTKAIKHIVVTGQLAAFLDLMSNNGMSRYSFNNRLLILMQLNDRRAEHDPNGDREDVPDFPLVMSAKAWQEKYGRTMVKGTSAIWIRGFSTRSVEEDDPDHPGQTRRRVTSVSFPPVPVFDISQTEGPPLSATEMLTLAGKSTQPPTAQAAIDHLSAHMTSMGYIVREERIGTDDLHELSTLGYTTADGSKRVVVDSRLEPARKAAVYAHEAGHIACGHVDGDYAEYRAHRGAMETEAEVTAYLVSRELGIETGDANAFAAPYIASWSKGDMAVVEKALTRATAAAKSILGEVGA